ncbi:serine hydrolase domain-containing protein [Pyxidicoccus xibeiensis]|uniref:serine hydrolase domain-containing protein n=1 Tax=Pyxidicoccus xibeiensis TaxID=2906759 RepID=UPI0020A76DAA|nr:serine hydrolase [Pyxidicoccus xibeiensis]MCP3140108.1 beta-lactamase family protein [Pyxidicoccus xibeiensis]
MKPTVSGLTLSLLLISCAARQPSPTAPRAPLDDLTAADPASLGIDPAPLAAMQTALQQGTYPKTTSVLIVKSGRLVYEGYFDGAEPGTLHDTRSSMKSVTALAVGLALQDGHLTSVDAPVFTHFADLRPFAHEDALKDQVTVADLLTMSSALDCNDDVPESPGNEENMYPLQSWVRWAVDLPMKRDYTRDASGRGPFAYCTAGSFLLGQLLQRTSGEPVDRYLERRLFAPLGITRMEWPRSPTGEVMTGGGLRLASRDLARLNWMLFAGGRWAGKQVLPEAWVREALTVHRKANEQQDYGYQFWRRDLASRCGVSSAWYMSGNGGNAMLQLPDQDAVVIVTRRNYNGRGMHQQTVRLLEDHVLKALPCERATTRQGETPR